MGEQPNRYRLNTLLIHGGLSAGSAGATTGHVTAKTLYNNKFGGILTFGLPDRDMAFRFINGLRLAKNLANIGDAKTFVIHPASTICSDFGPEEKALMGVSEEMVRVSDGDEVEFLYFMGGGY